jgi:ankyrin repeat protein
MTSAGAPEDYARYRRLDAAFRAGDYAALRAELAALEGFPDVVAHPAMGRCLTYAIYHSPIALVRALLEAGADPNGQDGDGFPPLIAALSSAVAAPGASTRMDAHELLEVLLAHGAGAGQRGINDYTPLHLAAAHGDLRAVDILLAHGADPNAITHIDDMETPLEVAAAAGHQAVVDRLRPLTTRPDWERASRAGDVATLKRMLLKGHDINARDGYGLTALMRAAHAGQLDTVGWLIARGADLNHTSKFHLSALMLAVIAGHPQIARVLVGAGADTTIRGTGAPGFHGKTAADLADARGDKRLAAFIRERTPARGD